MRRILAPVSFVGLAFLLSVVQVSFLSGSSSPLSLRPANLVLIGAFAFFFSWGYPAGLYTAFLGGLFYDVLVLRQLGQTSLVILGWLLVFAVLRRFVSRSRLFDWLFFYLAVVGDRLLLSNLTLRREFFLTSLVDVLVLFIFISLVKLLGALLNPPSITQLRFEDIR